MSVQLGAKPLADFDQPIDLLMDCHRRVERFLATLLNVAQNATQGRLEPQHRESLATALEYFTRAAPRHTEDEERSLFPRLRQSGDPRAAAALARIERLEADHRLADTAHRRIEELGRLWLAREHLLPEQVQEFADLARSLIALYREHIRCEDQELFPIAREVLSQEVLLEIGKEMKLRRAQDRGRPGSRCAERRSNLDATVLA